MTSGGDYETAFGLRAPEYRSDIIGIALTPAGGCTSQMKKRDGCDRFAGDAYRIIPSDIADDVVRQVADCIRLQDPKQTAYLKDGLAQIHGRYRRWRRQEADTPSRRELLDRLRRLQAAAAGLAAELATLGEDVSFRIERQAPRERDPPPDRMG